MTYATNGEWDEVAEPIRASADELRAEAVRLGIRRDFDVRVASANIVCGLMTRDVERAREAVEALDRLVAPHRPARRRRRAA